MGKYYSLETSGKETDLYIFGDITGYPWKEKDTDAYGIVKELRSIESDKINVHINSYGGDVAEGLAIYNVLKNSKSKVVTYCDGFACSAASVIFMSGDERIMNSASLLMIHNAWTYGSGNANDFRKQADDLDKITQASINAYLNKVNITEDEVKKLMNEETWLTAKESIDYGFATETVEEKETGMNQSAMKSIRNMIVNTPLQTEMVCIDGEKIAQAVAEKLKPLFEQKAKTPEGGTPEDSTGFGAFFNSGKGDITK
ncbi:MAG TPA: Clp protease ClpP [Candidatus Pelethocola excrementipullorum]|nr:Clp protease ClpP [Candidatus Pelethocola excrementipullorum]